MPRESYPKRLLVPLLFALTFPAGSMIQGHAIAEDAKPQSLKLIRGKTFDAWIVQAKEGSTLEDRHNALQVLRNDGLGHDRESTLRAFTDSLSDKSPSVRSLAAAGLIKAGRPTDPKATEKLVEIISKDLSAAKPPQLHPGQAVKDSNESDFPIREIRALGVIGDKHHIAALRRITENNKVHQLLRQIAETSIRQIEKRRSEPRSEPPKENN